MTVGPGTTTTTAAPAPAPGNPATVSAACGHVLGGDWTTSGLYASVGSYLVGNPAQSSTQAATHTYLINYVGTNPSVKSTVPAPRAGIGHGG